MAVSLQNPIGKDGRGSLADVVGVETIEEILDIATTARNLGLNDRQAEVLADFLNENPETDWTEAQRILAVLKDRFSTLEDLSNQFIYTYTTASLSSMGGGKRYGKVYLSCEHPSPELAEIIARHPQATVLCDGRAPDDVPLEEQLKIVARYFGAQRVIQRSLTAEFGTETAQRLGEHVNNWVSLRCRPNLSNMRQAVRFWAAREDQDIKLSLEHPYSPFAEIFTNHSDIIGLPKEYDVKKMPSKKQIAIAFYLFKGRGVIKDNLTAMLGEAEARVVSAHVIKCMLYGRVPSLSDASRMTQAWEMSPPQNIKRVRLSMGSPYIPLGELIIARHPQAKALCHPQDPRLLSLRQQIQFISDNFRDSGFVSIQKELAGKLGRDEAMKLGWRVMSWSQGHPPNLMDLLHVTDFWATRPTENIKLSLHHPYEPLANIIAQHPQATALCGGQDPQTVSLEKQCEILSTHFGSRDAINRQKITGADAGLGARVLSWFTQGHRPNLADLGCVTNFWATRPPENIKLSLDHPYAPFAEIITSHPQSVTLCEGSDAESLSLKEQLKILGKYYGGPDILQRELAVELGVDEATKFARRVGKWTSHGHLPNLLDLQQAERFWTSRRGVVLLDAPWLSLANAMMDKSPETTPARTLLLNRFANTQTNNGLLSVLGSDDPLFGSVIRKFNGRRPSEIKKALVRCNNVLPL